MTAVPAEPAGTAPSTRAPMVRLSWGSTIAGAVVVTLIRPLSWALGLAGFLAGGGVVLVAWPILVLPTPTGLQNGLGGPISSLVFGAPTTGLLLMIAGGIAGAMLLVVGLTLVGAWCEREGIRVALEAAEEEAIAPGASLDGAPATWRVGLIRLLALAPVALAIGLAASPVYDAAYRELILPDDLATPLPVRIVGDVPWLLIGIALTWLLSDAAAAVGVRRLVLERRPVLQAWLLGWLDLVRRPVRIVGVALVGVGLVALLLGPALVAAAVGWEKVRDILGSGRDPVVTLVAVVVWVSIWLGGLALAGVGAGIRASAWTLELPRRAPGEDAPPR